MNLRKLLFVLIVAQLFTLFQACNSENNDSTDLSIIDSAVSDPENPFYVNPGLYSVKQESMPIGVFDSGTGGLAVLEAILTLDEFNNETNLTGSDGIPDFISESFIYLADEANMPYGRYDLEGKSEFLRELVIKDVIFLAGDRYYLSPDEEKADNYKAPVKEIVIACNTATAYGLETVKQSAKDWNIPVKITGIIEAGAESALGAIEEENINNPLIAVLATDGTCASEGYPNTINSIAQRKYPDLDLKIIQQAGIGLAGSIDGDINYVNSTSTSARDLSEYFGPGLLSKDYVVDPALLGAYAFEGGNELLFETNAAGDTTDIQLNSIRNYVRYMVTELVHNATLRHPDRSIDIAILGCTHYPYEVNEIRNHFSYLDQLPEYTGIIPDSVIIIDPAESLAVSLYTNLVNNKLLGNNSMDESEFYISVPNILLEENKIDENMEFPYEWKYGREINTGMQYVKIVPFSDEWIDSDIKERIRVFLPATYKIMK